MECFMKESRSFWKFCQERSVFIQHPSQTTFTLEPLTLIIDMIENNEERHSDMTIETILAQENNFLQFFSIKAVPNYNDYQIIGAKIAFWN